MIPIIEKEVVDNYKWIKREDFIDIIAIAQSCPGVLAINMSVFIGYRLKKLPGALVTCLATALPSFIIILLIAMFFHQFEHNKVVEAMFRGIRPAWWLSLPPLHSSWRSRLTLRLTTAGFRSDAPWRYT